MKKLYSVLVGIVLILSVASPVYAEENAQDNLFIYEEKEGVVSDETGEEQGIVSILGDSLATYEGYNPWDMYYQYYCPEHMPVSDTWWMRYIESNHMRLGVNASFGGSKVSWQKEDASCYSQADCMAAQERIDRLGENGTPDTILFFGGTNDIASAELGEFKPNENIGDISTFYAAYQTAIVRLKNTYPDAKIICLTPYYRDVTIYTGAVETDNHAVDEYAEAIIDVCNYYDVSYVDLREAGIDPYEDMCAPDYLHVNEMGEYKIWHMLQNGYAALKIDSLCWQMNDTSIDIGMVCTGQQEGTVFRWQAYDLDRKQWEQITNWSDGNWASWRPKIGSYWLQGQARTADGAVISKTINFRVSRNYPVYITGTYQGPNPYGEGCLIGVSTNINPNNKYRYELLILDCEKYQNGDPHPWIYGTGLNTTNGTSFWATYNPVHRGYYWTYFRIYDENNNMIEDKCYGTYLQGSH